MSKWISPQGLKICMCKKHFGIPERWRGYFDLQKLEILQMYNVPSVLVAGGVLKFPLKRKYSVHVVYTCKKHIASTYMYIPVTCTCIYYPESSRNYCSCIDQMGLTNLDSLLPRCPYPCHICQFFQTISCQLKITLQLSQEFCKDNVQYVYISSKSPYEISNWLLERTQQLQQNTHNLINAAN